MTSRRSYLAAKLMRKQIDKENIMQESQKKPPLGIRMPDELKLQLKSEALKNRRSLNSEIVVRLENSMNTTEKEAA